MYQGKTLVTLAEEIERQKSAKRDFIARTDTQLDMQVHALNALNLQHLAADPEQAALPVPVINVKDQGAHPVTNTCHGQIAQWTSIPKRYYDRMLAEAPELLARNVNQWFNDQGTPRMLRTLDGRARAFLSNRYRILDHDDVLETVLPVLSDAGLSGSDIVSCEVTERRLYLKALFPKVQAEVKVGDIVQAGIVISNSEIGQGAVQAQPLIYRLSCRNGAIGADFGMRKYHVGRELGEGGDAYEFFKDDTLKAIDEAFMRKLRDVVSAAAQEVSFKKIVEKWAEATEQIVADPLGAVQEVQKKFTLTDDDKAGVLRHLIEGGDLSRFGIANALTRYSQDVADYDKATELERAGGQVIELAPNDWKTIETATHKAA